jgi:hypothetical protein
MATHHDDAIVSAGDDWAIAGLVLDPSGDPLDLTGAQLEWTLIDPNGLTCTLVSQAAILISGPATAGAITIKVPRAVTDLDPGRYHDALRVFLPTVSDTFDVASVWIGSIMVDANAFLLPIDGPFIDLLSAANIDTPAPVIGAP